MPDLNDKQQKMLAELMERRRKSFEESGKTTAQPAKKVVTPEEYARRLNSQISVDSNIASTMKRERIEAALAEWEIRVGRRFANAKVENADIAERVHRRVERIIAGGPLHRNSLVLTGHLGVGKTWTGYAYIRQLIEAGVLQAGEVSFGTEIGMLTPLALATYDRPDKIKSFLDPRYKFYLIDDVGRGTFKTAELRHEIWYEIINHAYENHIPIVLTTNKSSRPQPINDVHTNKQYNSEMEMWIGEAGYDRLKYMVGDDGAIVPGSKNRRSEANDQMDDAYERQSSQPAKSTPPSASSKARSEKTASTTNVRRSPSNNRKPAQAQGSGTDHSPF